MEKVIFFFCAFSCWIMQITFSDLSGGSSDVRVQTGENIILNCSMIDRYEIAWFHLNSEQLNILISAKKDKTGRKLLIKYNQNRTRMNITADTWVNGVSLTISGVTESDSGLYFCGIKSDAPEMQFDKPIRLEIKEEPKDVVDVTEEPNDLTDEVTVTERVLMFAGVGLAVFVFFLTTVIAGGIIYHRGWQRGLKAAKHGALMDQRSAE